MKINIYEDINSHLNDIGAYLEKELNKVPVRMDDDAYYDSAQLTFDVIAKNENSIYCRVTLDYPNGNKHIENFTIISEVWSTKYDNSTDSSTIYRIVSEDEFSPYSLGKGFNSGEEILDFIKQVEHIK